MLYAGSCRRHRSRLARRTRGAGCHAARAGATAPTVTMANEGTAFVILVFALALHPDHGAVARLWFALSSNLMVRGLHQQEGLHRRHFMQAAGGRYHASNFHQASHHTTAPAHHSGRLRQPQLERSARSSIVLQLERNPLVHHLHYDPHGC